MNKNLEVKQEAALRNILSEMPETSTYTPVTDSLNRATELGEDKIAAVLNGFSSMPQSTTVFANPVLDKAVVDCDGTQITLNIRSFAIRGIVSESEIVAGKLSPASVIFAGLFGRCPESDDNGLDEAAVLSGLIDSKFYEFITTRRESLTGEHRLVNQVAGICESLPRSRPRSCHSTLLNTP